MTYQEFRRPLEYNSECTSPWPWGLVYHRAEVVKESHINWKFKEDDITKSFKSLIDRH